MGWIRAPLQILASMLLSAPRGTHHTHPLQWVHDKAQTWYSLQSTHPLVVWYQGDVLETLSEGTIQHASLSSSNPPTFEMYLYNRLGPPASQSNHAKQAPERERILVRKRVLISCGLIRQSTCPKKFHKTTYSCKREVCTTWHVALNNTVICALNNHQKKGHVSR